MPRFPFRAPRFFFLALCCLLGAAVPLASRAQDVDKAPPDNPSASVSAPPPMSDDGSAIVNAPSATVATPDQGNQAAPANPVPMPTATTTTTLAARHGADACAEALRHESAQNQQEAAVAHTTPAPLVLPPECGATVSSGPAAK